MGREYDLEQNSTFRLPLSYGNLPVKGFFVRHETMAVGSDLQVTLQSALGEGEWDGVDKLGYNGQIIASQYFNLHRGQTGETAADDFFPSDVNHPNAAFINVRLPIGMATDNDPDKLVGNYRCRKINNYDANGNVIGNGFSRNPARIAADVIKNTRPRMLNEIDWASWVEWRDWCDVLINTIKDGVTVQVPRFELNLFFDFPIETEAAIDYICQLTCTDTQWIEGAKLRFLCPIDRPTETFTFDLSQVDEENYQFVPTDRQSRPNMVVIEWRNFDDEFYKKEDPIIVKRTELITQDGGENPLIINAGICRKNQAERLAHFWAKMRCDATEFSAIIAGWKSFPMLPGDVVKFTHDIPDYINRRFKIIEKEEHESEGLGYQIKLQDIPANAYSDTDQTPLVLHPADERPNPFAAPPVPSFSLSPQSVEKADGSIFTTIVGTVQFGVFGFKQSAKVYVMSPGGSYKFLTDITPDLNNEAVFRASNLPVGLHWFKVVAVSDLGVQQIGVGNDQSFTINAATFYVDGVAISIGAYRALSTITPENRVKGRDTAIVDRTAIRAYIETSEIIGLNNLVVLAIQIIDLTGTHNQADSATAVQVDVYNQFGERIKILFPTNLSQKAASVTFSYPRKYADALEGQAYFAIRAVNYTNSYCLPVYLQQTYLNLSEPIKKSRSNCPLELNALAISANTIQITYQFSGTCNLYRRLVGETNWVQHVTGISGSPFNAIGFAESSDYELQLRSAADESNRSNICRVRTKQQGDVAPSRPAPTALSGNPNSSSPTTAIDISWSRNATDNVNVEIWKDGSLFDTVSGTQTYYNFTGLANGTNFTYKVRNKWGSSDFSEFSNEVTIGTDSPPPAPQQPLMTSWFYDTAAASGAGASILYWTPRGGAGTYTVQYKEYPGAAWVTLTSTLPSTDTGFGHITPRTPGVTKYYTYRIKRNDLSDWASEVVVEIPAGDVYEPPPGGGHCFIAGTKIMSATFWRRMLFNWQFYLFGQILFGYNLIFKSIENIKEGEKVYSPNANGKLEIKTVLRTFVHEADEYLLVRFAGKNNATGVTREHPYKLTDGSFEFIANITEGSDVLSRRNGKQITRQIISKELVKETVIVYNFEVEDNHTYVANENDVHNKEDLLD